jgi:hypothetical protein
MRQLIDEKNDPDEEEIEAQYLQENEHKLKAPLSVAPKDKNA